MADKGADTLSLIGELRPLYAEFFELLRRNASLELDVKELAVAQVRLVSGPAGDSKESQDELLQMSERKARSLAEMTDNSIAMDRIRLKIQAMDPGDPFVKRDHYLTLELEGVGKDVGLHALDLGAEQIEQLGRLSEEIRALGFGDDNRPAPKGGEFDPWAPCLCTGCTGCGTCTGCTSCTGCNVCGGLCSVCFGVSIASPHSVHDMERSRV